MTEPPAGTAQPSRLAVWALEGIGEIQSGDDLAAIIGDAYAADAKPGDILAITSKIVSKAEGRMRQAADREQAITDETVRLVASRRHAHGITRIVQNRQGLVLAAAGVDASNTPDGTILLLPEDPDASALAIATSLRERLGIDVGVVITDTLGRPWRAGQTDVAIGAAGIAVIEPLRGQTDSHGRELTVTAAAVADEIAAAADLVKGKTSGCPVAVVRGLARLVGDLDEPGAHRLVRGAADDMFRQGAQEAYDEGRGAGRVEGRAEAIAEASAEVSTAESAEVSTAVSTESIAEPVTEQTEPQERA